MELYPLLDNAVPEIRRALDPSTASLEDFLREYYRDSVSPHHQAILRVIPLYLQQLLFQASTQWTRRSDWYALLVSEALRQFEKVVFITLNYDTLLDRVLHSLEPLTGIDSFIQVTDMKPAALLKLHGSVTWRRRILGESGFDAARPTNLELDPRIRHHWEADFGSLRLTENEAGMFGAAHGYPVLSTPLGAEDDLNIPDNHLDFLNSELTAHRDGMTMLIIGYSGLDQALLRLLVAAEVTVGHVKIVDVSLPSAQEVLARLKQQVEIHDFEFSKLSFGGFAAGGEMSDYLKRIAGWRLTR